MKYLMIILLLGSCATPVKKLKNPVYKTKQHNVLDCFKFIKKFGSSDEFSGKFCKEVFNVGM